MSDNLLVCDSLSKSYGKKEVLQNLNLELEKGKIYGLIGRNGAGKTTLLSLMSGQNPANAGTVTCNGMPVWENERALEHICFSRELNPMTANGANSMKVKKYFKTAAIYMPNWDKELAKRLAEEFELDVNKRISKLSKGMMSMVSIIVALASKADYTFLDEPVAGLDVVARENFYRILLEEFAESGRTFVISTHIIEEASDVFEEVIMINGGRIILKENTMDLLDRARHISGKAEDVDELLKKYDAYHVEKMGRSKGATLLLKEGQSTEELSGNPDILVQPVTLQQVFVALCGKEAE